MRAAHISLDIPTQVFDDTYTYVIPDSMDNIEVGCAVLVPFNHRPCVGFVLEIGDVLDLIDAPSTDGASFQPTLEMIDADDDVARRIAGYKMVSRVLSHAFFNEHGAACALFLSHRYIAPLSSCVRLFTPPGAVPRVAKQAGHWQVIDPPVGEIDDRWVCLGSAAATFTPRKNAVKQIAILRALTQGPLRITDLHAEYGAVTSTIHALEKRNVVCIEHRRRMRGDLSNTASPDSESHIQQSTFVPTPKPVLTQGQSHALDAIQSARSHKDGHVVLVDGVTGSGKTEVYLQAIEDVLHEGQGAIVLVPEISLTPQTVARFRGRFGDTVAVMHSRMSPGERFDQWDVIRSGQARVVVGARSALFTPVNNLGLIVIDEEHETTYKQDSAPRYVARDVAAWIAQRVGATLVLGSATPSIETLYNVNHVDGWTQTVLPERANGRPLPPIDVVDMAREFGGGSRSMFSKTLQSALEKALRDGHKAVLLLNQRGFASFLLCRDCGYVPECPECAISLTYHERGNQLVCHHCGYRIAAPARCPHCGSPYLKRFGAGTQRVEAELRSLISSFELDVPVIRMDADTTSKKGAHQKLLESFAAADAAVLLGTQMIAKGLDFDDVVLVGVINADTQLRLPDFRSGERTFDLIDQVAGRAGRANLPGRVIVQTYSADEVPIRAAASYNRKAFLDDELAKRKVLHYPPFVRLADILVWGKGESIVADEANSLYHEIIACVSASDSSDADEWMVYPSSPCTITRLRGAYRYHIAVKAPRDIDIASVIGSVFRNRKAKQEISVALDIDPVSML